MIVWMNGSKEMSELHHRQENLTSLMSFSAPSRSGLSIVKELCASAASFVLHDRDPCPQGLTLAHLTLPRP